MYHDENAKAHPKAYEFYLKDQGIEKNENVKQRITKMRKFKYSGAGSSSIISVLATREGNEVEQTHLKFESDFFVAKEEYPLTKFKKNFRS